ncbi:MAG: MarR family transcriptional regulator [Actinobacteria bacterium]|nr:MarR family transcriptional regulator [Actinomycetota bacterium]
MQPLRFDPIDEAKRHWEDHGWKQASPGMAVITSVMRVQQIFLQRAEEVLRPYELTFSRYEVLMLLTFSRKGRLPLSKIGERLQVHGSSVTNAIDRLERQGFVRRVPNPSDGRGTLAELSAAGRRIARRATDDLNELVFADLGLTDRDETMLYRVLRRVRAAAGDFREG